MPHESAGLSILKVKLNIVNNYII
ncbi:hypothetical protein TRIP_E230110 [uncultured Spirochaetota bacterium]|nr:hypothetical protein TRIP_E230110 [uncultured Spirochaetota bacterium]